MRVAWKAEVLNWCCLISLAGGRYGPDPRSPFFQVLGADSVEGRGAEAGAVQPGGGG